MKKCVFAFLAVFAVFVFAISCSSGGSSDPVVEDPTGTTGNISIRLPGTPRAVSADDVDRFTVIVTSTPLSYSKEFSGTPGQTLTVSNLVPGSYDISVNAYDDDLAPTDQLVFTGSATAVVEAGATASVSITLTPAVGDLDVDVTFPEDPSTVTRQRLKGVKDYYAYSYVTYNANGIVSRYDYYLQDMTVIPHTYSLNNYIIYEFSDDQTRSGGKQYDGSGTQTGTITISHDGSGNETVHTYRDLVDTITSTIEATYNANNTAIIKLTQISNSSPDDEHIRYFHENGDYKGAEGNSYIYIDDLYADIWNDPATHKLLMSYDTNTRIPVQFDHYIDGVLADTETRTLSPSGFYQKAEHKRVDESLISFVIYGNPIDLGDYYAQPATRTFFADPNTITNNEFESSYTYYQLFTKTFQPAGTTIAMRTYEPGTVKSGIINLVYLNTGTN